MQNLIADSDVGDNPQHLKEFFDQTTPNTSNEGFYEIQNTNETICRLWTCTAETNLENAQDKKPAGNQMNIFGPLNWSKARG
jgi:hypothetical protein